MKTLGVSMLALALSLAGAAPVSAKGPAKGKPTAKGGKGKAAAAEENPASPEEINKLKGDFKWGMQHEEVMKAVRENIEGRYADRLKKANLDPGKQDRIRQEMREEVNQVKKSLTKFEGVKTGYDVSIIDQEFAHNTGESMFFTKEDTWTRYFFFVEGGLYKMYLALNKDALKGKTFEQFAEMMQAKYGKARPVMRDEKVKGGTKKVLDHLLWASMTSDSLKLVDRSQFYDVYCLVVYDQGTADRVAEKRRLTAPAAETGGGIVDAVTAKEDNNRDANDNIIDRLTGKDVKKPGEEEKHADIVVPSVRAPTAAEVNASSKKADDKKKDDKKGKKPTGLDGLDL